MCVCGGGGRQRGQMFSLSFLLEVREEKAHLRECLLHSSLLRTQIGVPLLLFG